MDSGNPGLSRKSTRPTWLKPGEVWGGDNNDDPQIGSTLGLRVKRWYRRLPGLSVGSKVTLRKMLFVLIATVTLYLFLQQKLGFPNCQSSACPTCSQNKTSPGPTPAFDPPELSNYRTPDSMDAFSNYQYRNNTNCQISSQHLHTPFAPLCTTRADMLEAISGGGRIGFGAPFMPRGCDMRWFTTEEICQIFSRFEKVIVVGDSLMRHVVGALNVLLRKDLGYGAVTNWNFSPKEKYAPPVMAALSCSILRLFLLTFVALPRRECFCNKQFNVKDCIVQGIFRTSDVLANDPDSFACSQPDVDLTIEMMLKFPLDPTEVARFKDLLAPTKPAKPYAFIFGHGLWNDLDLHATLNWLDGILAYTKEAAPYVAQKGALWPRLMVTPNAAGTLKPDQWVQSQGDKALQLFEKSVRIEAAERGVEHLGTWNMSIQTEKFDGVHLDLKGNLVKAMAVVNWLALVDME